MPPTAVVAVPAREQPVNETISLVGSLSADEVVEIKSEIDATISAIHFEEGQTVKKGALLIELDASKLQAAVAEAEATFKLSELNFNRSRQLQAENLVAQQEFDQAAAVFNANRATVDLRRRQLADTKLFAPFAGIVGTRFVSPGQVINRNTTLTWIVDADPVKLEVGVPERFLSQVRTGQNLTMTVATFPKESFKGQVYFIAPLVDPATRTAMVKAVVPNADGRLKPGMFVNFELTLQVRERGIVIPESALILNGERTMVMVVDTNQTAQPRPVRVGMRLPGAVEITQGLKDGEMVITEGIQKSRPGAPVKVSPPDQPGAAPTNRPPPKA